MTKSDQLDQDALILEETAAWVQNFVVALNICPFAGTVVEQQRIRYQLSSARDIDILYQDFLTELLFLHDSDPQQVETTLLVHPYVLEDFYLYLDFVDQAEQAIREAGLEGDFQIASFHPDYQFEGEAPANVTNYTNRSPYPMLHILREDSVSYAVDNHPNVDGIPIRNMEKLKELGLEEVRRITNTK